MNTKSPEEFMNTGYTRYEIVIAQNTWVRIADHSNRRVAIHLQPTNPSVVITFGQNAPVAVPTLIQPFPSNPSFLNDEMAAAMTRGPIWAYTTSAGVTMIVTEEMRNDL